ncbi:MAG: LCP family protein [Ruthenibacterium sp.]
MSNPHQPREIDISRARVRRTAQPIQPVNRSAPTPPAEQRVARPQQQTTPPPRRTAPQQAQPRRRAPENTNAQPRRRMPSEKDRMKKKNPWKTALKVLCILLLVFGGIYFGLRLYAGAITTTGDMGTLDKTQVLGTPPEFKGKQLNLLVLGIDYTTEDAEIVQRDPIGNTDMLLYCQFDFEKDTMKMLQIPRDTFVGEIGGKAGKINGVFANSADPDNRVSTVASLVSQQLNLPIDNYVTIDMDALREIVDKFNGIEIDIPYDIIDHDKNGNETSKLLKGKRNLKGAELEFFLRARDMLPRQDIDRLDNQRNFYKALFGEIRTATPGDLWKLIPVYATKVNTDLSVDDLVGVGINMLSIKNENIMMCRLPVARGELYNTHDVMVAAKPEIADLLNQYFRPADAPVGAEGIKTAEHPTRDVVVEANVEWFGAHVEPSDSAAVPAAGSTVTDPAQTPAAPAA